MTIQKQKIDDDGRLVEGERYDLITLAVIGWTDGDRAAAGDYNAGDYFDDGRYLGPDKLGIEPLFEIDELMRSL